MRLSRGALTRLELITRVTMMPGGTCAGNPEERPDPVADTPGTIASAIGRAWSWMSPKPADLYTEGSRLNQPCSDKDRLEIVSCNPIREVRRCYASDDRP